MNAVTKLFRRAEELPARAALRSHLREVQSLQAKRSALSTQAAAAREDVQRGNAAEARAKGISDGIDLAMADQRYSGESREDIGALRVQLAEAQSQTTKLSAVARSAAIAVARYDSDLHQLATQASVLIAKTSTLLREALLEEMTARRPAYEQAKQQLTAALHSVLACACAHDQLAERDGSKKIGSDSLFVMSLPDPYASDKLLVDTDEQIAAGKALAEEHRAFDASVAATHAKGVTLINQLLSGAEV